MASESGGLSQEEFLLIQTQMIDLRNKNYELQEQLKRKSAEIVNLSQSHQSIPKNEALQFASKLMSRGNSKDKEKQEEIIRMKLADQEEEFRLQQETLISELNKVVTQCEAYEKENELLREQTGSDVPAVRNVLVAELEKENHKLKEERELLMEQSSIIKASVTEKQLLVEKLEEELLNTKRLLQALEDQMINCRKSLDVASMNGQTSSAEILTMKAQLASVEKDRLDSEQKFSEMSTLVEKTNDAYTTLLSEKIETDLQCEQLKQDLASTSQSLTGSMKEVKDLRQNIVNMELRLTTEKKENEVLTSRLEEAVNIIATLEKASKDNHIQHQNELEDLMKKAESDRVIFESKCEDEKRSATEEVLSQKNLVEELSKKLSDREDAEARELEQRMLLLETKYQLELSDREKQHSQEKIRLEEEVKSLEDSLKLKDDEKAIALKKQSAMLKELHRSLKDERKRADSMEKARQAGDWHVVADSDSHSRLRKKRLQTFDGNESISSLSALESDNNELISRLTVMQKMHAENIDKINKLESDNSRLSREAEERSELIEQWIRTRPIGPAVGQPNGTKTEGSLRKFLSSTLGSDSTADMKEMNKKLQRMLEETLSKNILLQRDLQTLLERTEM